MDPDPHVDLAADEFAEHGLITEITRTTVYMNHTRGTVRGLERQLPPHGNAKLVRCIRGSIAAVAVDLRPESPTHGNHVMVELSAESHRALFLPPYIAHGFQTLTDDTEVLYQISGQSVSDSEEHFRWNEPQFGVQWPLPVTVISEEDASWPLLAEGSSPLAPTGTTPS